MNIPMDKIDLIVVVLASLIMVLDTINMNLSLNSLGNHIVLIMDSQTKRLSQDIQVMNNSFNHIFTM